jgi:hypothetical protein
VPKSRNCVSNPGRGKRSLFQNIHVASRVHPAISVILFISLYQLWELHELIIEFKSGPSKNLETRDTVDNFTALRGTENKIRNNGDPKGEMAIILMGFISDLMKKLSCSCI